MNKHGIFHIPEAPFAYGINENTLYIKIRVAAKDIKSVKLYCKDRYNWDGSFPCYEMEKIISSELFDYFKAEVKVREKRFRYFFKIIDNNNEEVYLNEKGLQKEIPNEGGAFQFPYIALGDLYREVKWPQEGIAYQIFPDRFFNGNKSNDPKDVMKWGEEVTTRNFFGGDIKGITEKLDYIKDLGVTFIYMTPIFKSSSNHKYNTCDYYEIDEMFGTKEEFRELIKEAHKREIKIILDGVFNHTGADFFAFKDLIEKGEKSKYKDWFFVEEYPVDLEKINYVTFANKVKYMPKINMNNKDTRNYFLNVAKYWIEELDIDGWRLDVCDEVDHLFWREFREAVKSVKEDAFIIGEIMHQGRNFLKGEELDSIMNYPFREASLDFFAKRTIDAKKLNDILMEKKAWSMESINRQMLNLLDSHDTARFLTDSDGNIDRLKLAVVFQYTFEGIPYIYYGDEIGMKGETDPYCRRCMVWDEEKQNIDLKNHFKKLGKIRKENKELIYGKYNSLIKDKFLLVYERVLGDEKSLIIINNDLTSKEVEICGKFKDLYENKHLEINNKILINPMDFKILKAK